MQKTRHHDTEFEGAESGEDRRLQMSCKRRVLDILLCLACCRKLAHHGGQDSTLREAKNTIKRTCQEDKN